MDMIPKDVDLTYFLKEDVLRSSMRSIRCDSILVHVADSKYLE